MKNSLFFNNIPINDNNSEIIKKIEEYTNINKNNQLYLINTPLGGRKYEYDYQDNVIIILSPKYKIIFINVLENTEDFEEYYDDFIEDLGYVSDKYNYKKHIGRPKKWIKKLTSKINIKKENFDIKNILYENKIDKLLYRKNELIISLLVGSINDIEKIGVNEPIELLEKIKNKIVLFDGEQTRFIYKPVLRKKSVYIQGLSGTGKTELLLHKLKEIYSQTEQSKIFFTCHNIALANTLKKRIPEFFNFMKVEKQIKWNERLWTDRAWGSKYDEHSGLYSYICHFYKIQFHRYNKLNSYKKIFTDALNEINKIDSTNFNYAFDYILIDERQDFPDVFFELCEKITKTRVFIAGDIFQDIFESNFEQKVVDVDFILNRCYRTDPRTLMFSHAIGMGLFEEKKLNWLTDKEWEASGYIIKRKEKSLYLYREPIRRFSDLENENIDSIIIENLTGNEQIIDIIKNIKDNHPTLLPDDVAIIILDTDNGIYNYIDRLEFDIGNSLGWSVNKSYESKEKITNSLFISNKNNVKGLEFPFVICITASIVDNYRYRNTLYTMLTRSFIQSYLLVKNNSGLDVQKTGLNYINNKKYIKTIEPSDEEKESIKNTIIRLKNEKNISYKDFLDDIFLILNINLDCRKEIEKHIPKKIQFNRDETIKFINQSKEFYCD